MSVNEEINFQTDKRLQLQQRHPDAKQLLKCLYSCVQFLCGNSFSSFRKLTNFSSCFYKSKVQNYITSTSID